MDKRLKELRKLLGKTQQQFADTLGLKRQTIAAYEIGKITPSESTLLLICEKFGVSRDWIVSGTGEPFLSKDESFSKLISELEDSNDDFIKTFISVYMCLDPASKSALQSIAKKMADKYRNQT